jgi:hypothetical protein
VALELNAEPLPTVSMATQWVSAFMESTKHIDQTNNGAIPKIQLITSNTVTGQRFRSAFLLLVQKKNFNCE